MGNSIIERRFAKKLKNRKNKSIVELYIKNDSDFYNNYSYLNNIDNKNIMINENVINYLVKETENISIKNSLLIYIKKISKVLQQEDSIEKLIKEDIHEKIFIISKRIRNINIHSIILALIGMLLIGITQLPKFEAKYFSFKEFVIVMSWVFMWKAVDLIFFEKAGLLKKRGTLMKIYFSEIKIENISE